MSDAQDNRSPLQRLWDTYCSIRAEQGLDMPEIFRAWAKSKRESLEKFNATSSFEELCNSGCREFPLALALAMLGPMAEVMSTWDSLTGPPRRREQKIRLFEKAATALEELQAALVDSIIESERETFPPAIFDFLRKKLIHPSDLETSWPKDSPAPHSSTTIRALRSYASYLRKVGTIPEEAHIGSPVMDFVICKLLIRRWLNVLHLDGIPLPWMTTRRGET